MFALRPEKVASQLKKKVGLEKQDAMENGEDELLRARFQEIGPRMTVKMRWIRRGALGETGNERSAREKGEKDAGLEVERAPDEELEGAEKDSGDEGEEEEEKVAAKELGIDEDDEESQPNFDFASAAASVDPSVPAPSTPSLPLVKVKKPRTIPRKRKLPYHALLRPPPSSSPPPGYVDSEPAPLPPTDGKKREMSLLSTVGKTWHAGKGEGGVRESKKRREWNWEVGLFVSLLVVFADALLCRRKCKSREESSSFDFVSRCSFISLLLSHCATAVIHFVPSFPSREQASRTNLSFSNSARLSSSSALRFG